MSKTISKGYAEELEKGYDYRRAMEEASRCLLCYDAPCSKGCPAGTDPAKFIRSLRFRNVKGAAETIRENNPLAGSCARVCPYGRLCEEACSRCGIDEPIHIGKLQRFLVEEEEQGNWQFVKPEAKNGRKVACVGAGPASLACARELARKGYEVTVYEAREKAGGILTYGILPSRLPQKVVDYDLSLIEAAGVRFSFGTKIDAAGAAELKKKYDAVFVGIGLGRPNEMQIPGSHLNGVFHAIEFLEQARNNADIVRMAAPVVVIGGGDVAMDCAMTAKQLGSDHAMIIYRRSIEEAPADTAELAYVQGMGIPIFPRFVPKEIIGQEGQVCAVRCEGCDGESDLLMKAGQVVFAVGQRLEEEYTDAVFGEGIFFGGDMVHPKGRTVVEAVADGKAAAKQIIAYLS